VVASPAGLRVSDSLAVTFKGDKLKNADVSSVRFDGTVVLQAKLDGSELTVYVTSAVTKTPGHKELTVVDKSAKSDKDKLISLPLDVYK